MTHQPGQVLIHRYEIQRLVGQGGMGAVYRAKDLHSMATVAIKQLREDSSTGLSTAVMKTKFDQEWQTLLQLNHPRIPKMLDSFSQDDSLYYVMEFIEGVSLAQKLRDLKGQGRRFPEVLLIEYGLQILDIVQYLHGLEPPLLHRDIKPENLIVRDADGELTLVDFGLARDVSSSLGQNTKTQVGTLGFAALEQVKGKPEKRSDLYGVGATLWFLLAGEVPAPFDIRPVEEFRNDVFPSLAEVVNRACQTNPERRFMSAAKMELALRKVHSELTGTPLDVRAQQLFVEESPIQVQLAAPAPMSSAQFLFYMAIVTVLVFGGILALAQAKKWSQMAAQSSATPVAESSQAELPTIIATQQPRRVDGYQLGASRGPISVRQASPSQIQLNGALLGPEWQLVGMAGESQANGLLIAETGRTSAMIFKRSRPIHLQTANVRLMREGGPATIQISLHDTQASHSLTILSKYENGTYFQVLVADEQSSPPMQLPKDPYEFNMTLTLGNTGQGYSLSSDSGHNVSIETAPFQCDEVRVIVPSANQAQRIRLGSLSLTGS